MTAPTQEQLLDVRRRLARERLERFDPLMLLRLAALPEWSEPLARAAGGLQPESPGNEPELLAAEGLCELGDDIAPSGDLVRTFWLRPSQRPEVAAHLRRELGIRLPDEVQRVIDHVQQAVSAEPELQTPVLRGWLKVAVVHRKDPSGFGLLDEVNELVVSGSTPDAIALVCAAGVLGDLLGEPLSSAARRAQWRLDRGYRQAADARRLRDYVPRPEVEQALVELLRDQPQWALHLIGGGGVGKTMVIRDLAAGHFTERHGLADFPVARVDFDHLDPRFPEDRPGELLLALAGELLGYTATRGGSRSLRKLDHAVAAWHEELDRSDVREQARRTLRDDAVAAFAEVTRGLGERVMLVLDTVEELAKLGTPGLPSRAVEATFDLLEGVHDLARGVRVLLAGRRWLVPPPEGTVAPATGFLLPQDFLRVFMVRGFDPRTAREYLAGSAAGADRAGIPEPMVQAILERCTGSDGLSNPFDLSCYRQWCLDEPDLDPERLRSASGDPYVEQRILARISAPDVRAALPAAVELGRLELAMIEPALRRAGADPAAAFAGLASQEWVSALSFRDGRPRVVEIDEHLRPRLARVLAADPDRFPLDRPQLGREVADVVDHAEHVADLAVEAMEAALRLLPVEEAGRLWSRFERRLADEDAWGWASQVLPRLAAVETERAAAGMGPTLFAAVRATQAAAALRLPGRPGADTFWSETVSYAQRHPDQDEGRRLPLRGLLGLDAVSGTHLAQFDLKRLAGDDVGDWPPDAGVAAVEAAAGHTPRLVPFAPLLELLCTPTMPPDLRGAALLARAAWSLDQGRPEQARVDADAALELAGIGERHWVDWVPPARPVERARLARVLIARALAEPLDTLPHEQWLADAQPHLADGDAERLASACLAWRADWEVSPVGREMLDLDAYSPHRTSGGSYWSHRIEPLICTVGRVLGAGGEVNVAAERLGARREEALLSAADPATAADCDVTLVQLSRMARRQLTAVGKLAEDPTSPVRDDAWAVLTLVDGLRPESPDQTASWHGWWRVQGLATAEADLRDRAGDGLVAAVDELEYRLAAAEQPAVDAVAGALAAVDGAAPVDDAILGAWLRGNAILDRPIPAHPWSRPLRRAAEAALAEAELLGLRLPGPAMALFDYAATRFAEAGDAVGMARAEILLSLTAWRFGVQATRTLSASLDPVTQQRLQQLGSGWADRMELALELQAGSPASPSIAGSPELRPVEVLMSEARTAAPRSAPPIGVPLPQHSAAPSSELKAPPPPPARPFTAKRRRLWPALILVGLIVVILAVLVGLNLVAPAGHNTVSPTPTPTTSVTSTPRPTTTPSVSGTSIPTTGASGSTASPSSLPSLGSSRSNSWPWVLGVGGVLAVVAAGILIVRGVVRAVNRMPSTPQWRQTSICVAVESQTCRISYVLGDPGKPAEPLKCVPFGGERPLPFLATVLAETPADRGSLPYLTVPVVVPRGAQADPHEQRLARELTALDGQHPLWMRVQTPTLTWESPAGGPRTLAYTGPRELPAPDTPQASVSGGPTVRVVVGAPLRTTAGWRINVLDADPGQESPSGSRGGSAAELVGPDDLLHNRPVLIVLMEEPVDGPPQPLRTVRQGWSELIAELGPYGLPAPVVLVPPVPDHIAAQVVDLVVRRICTQHDRWFPLAVLDLVHEVRTLVADAAQPAAAGDDRPELDVLLFV